MGVSIHRSERSLIIDGFEQPLFATELMLNRREFQRCDQQ
jgi:hypothetical protein